MPLVHSLVPSRKSQFLVPSRSWVNTTAAKHQALERQSVGCGFLGIQHVFFAKQSTSKKVHFRWAWWNLQVCAHVKRGFTPFLKNHESKLYVCLGALITPTAPAAHSNGTYKHRKNPTKARFQAWTWQRCPPMQTPCNIWTTEAFTSMQRKLMQPKSWN